MPAISTQDSICPQAGARALDGGFSARVTEQLAVYRQVRDLQWRAIRSGLPVTTECLLEMAGVTHQIAAEDLRSVPASGPVLVAANRLGVLECLLLAAVLGRARSDVRVLAPHFLATIAPLKSQFIAVDPWRTSGGVARNHGALGKAMSWLKLGGALVVFPGEERQAWLACHHGRLAMNTPVTRIVRMTGAVAIPASIEWREPLAGSAKSAEPLRRAEVRLGFPVSNQILSPIPALDDAASPSALVG
jgi:hypothetical protein